MSIHTEAELRHGLKINGNISIEMIKQMMRVMLNIIDAQQQQIDRQSTRIHHLEDNQPLFGNI